jgi:hypothetical protein
MIKELELLKQSEYLQNKGLHSDKDVLKLNKLIYEKEVNNGSYNS